MALDYSELGPTWGIFQLFKLSGQYADQKITCSKLTIEKLEQGVKYVQS